MQGINLIMFPLTYAALVCSLTCVTISVVCDTCSDGGQTIYLFHFCGSIVAFFSKYKKKKKERNLCFFVTLHILISTSFLFLLSFHFLLPSVNSHLISAGWTTLTSKCHNQNGEELKSLLQVRSTGRVLLLSLCPSFLNRAVFSLGMLRFCPVFCSEIWRLAIVYIMKIMIIAEIFFFSIYIKVFSVDSGFS